VTIRLDSLQEAREAEERMRNVEVVHRRGEIGANKDFITQSEVTILYCGATLECFRAIFFAGFAEVLLVAAGILMWKAEMF
jgi:hypothetical protein